MTDGRPLFDPQVIRNLADNLGNNSLASRFLNDYLDLLPRRKTRIINALHAEDPDAAMDAILSLKIASAMVGAHDAEDKCRALQSLIANGQLNTARREATALGTSLDTLIIDAPHILASLQPHLAG